MQVAPDGQDLEPPASADLHNLSGTVVEAGDGSTHVVPVVNGYVVGGAIKSVPLGGSNITAFVQSLQRERKEPLPAESSLEICRCDLLYFTWHRCVCFQCTATL